MEIADIIGKGKMLEPPFKIVDTLISDTLCLMDNKHKVVLTAWKSEFDNAFFGHICSLLNNEWNSKEPANDAAEKSAPLSTAKTSKEEFAQDGADDLKIETTPSEYPPGTFLTLVDSNETFLHDGTKTKDGYGIAIGPTGGIWMKSNGYGHFCYGCDARLATKEEIEKFIGDVHKASLIKG